LQRRQTRGGALAAEVARRRLLRRGGAALHAERPGAAAARDDESDAGAALDPDGPRRAQGARHRPRADAVPAALGHQRRHLLHGHYLRRRRQHPLAQRRHYHRRRRAGRRLLHRHPPCRQVQYKFILRIKYSKCIIFGWDYRKKSHFGIDSN